MGPERGSTTRSNLADTGCTEFFQCLGFQLTLLRFTEPRSGRSGKNENPNGNLSASLCVLRVSALKSGRFDLRASASKLPRVDVAN